MDNGWQDNMHGRRYAPEEIISKLREAEVLLGHSATHAGQVASRSAKARALGIGE